MAVENLTDRFHLNNSHVQGYTVANIDLTGRVVKWALSVLDAEGVFDPTVIDLEKTTDTPGDTTLVDGPTGQIDVNIDPADTLALAVGNYHFQLEVFDAGGNNGVVVSSGKATLVANLVETV